MTEVHGTLDEKFAPVRATFERNFAERDDMGACVAVSLEGEMVVDLWAGYRNEAGTEPWQEDTIVNVYSSTKTMAALTMLVLADRGEIDFYEKVATYWPEFAQNGKENIEVRHFMSHSAGLSGLDEPMGAPEVYDWDNVVRALERQAPWWEPGTASGYHALTQGHLQGEIVRRVTGKSMGTFFADEIAGPLGADFHIGTRDEHFSRIGELIPPEVDPASQRADDGSIASRTFASPWIPALQSRTPEWRRAEIPAGNGHGNARSIVRAQTPLANGGSAWGVDLLSAEGAAMIFDEQTNGEDLVLDMPVRFGMGYGLTSEAMPMGPNEHIAYWGGWGGSTVVVDQDAHMVVSYVMNRMDSGVMGDVRGFSLTQAAYQSIG